MRERCGSRRSCHFEDNIVMRISCAIRSRYHKILDSSPGKKLGGKSSVKSNKYHNLRQWLYYATPCRLEMSVLRLEREMKARR